MKIYLLALLGLAAGGVVKTISTSSTSDSTIAASPDSSAPVVASSDISHTTASPTRSTPSSTTPTSSPSSIGSIDSSTSSHTAPAGDDISEIAVSMTFSAEAIDDASDKEMFATIKKSVTDSLHRALGTDLIDVVETVPAGRRLAAKTSVLVTYTVKVKETGQAALENAVKSSQFKSSFSEDLADATTIAVETVTTSVILPAGKICHDDPPPAVSGTKLTCNNKTVDSTASCGIECTDKTKYVVDTLPDIKCIAGDAKGGKWADNGKGTCVRGCDNPEESAFVDGTIQCDDAMRKHGGKLNACPITCKEDYHIKSKASHTCTSEASSAGAWAGGVNGMCVKACGDAATATTECWTSKGIGLCKEKVASDGQFVVCQADVDVLCDGNAVDGTTVCGKTANTLQGKCKTTGGKKYCMYTEKDVWIGVTMAFTYEEGDAAKVAEIVALKNETFNNHFKASVADTLTEVTAATSVKIKLIEDKTPSTRRLDGKFLQNDPTRMLQVEYSVQVNQSDAAAAKAALDSQSSFMYSSNST